MSTQADVIQAACDFVHNVQAGHIEGGAYVKSDNSFQELRKAVEEISPEVPAFLEPVLPAKMYDAFQDLLVAHGAFFVDWDSMNNASPDYDPAYRPSYPEVYSRAHAVLTAIKRGETPC